MLTLGFSGGFEGVAETQYPIRFNQMHDAAAVLVRDGEVLAAAEEERLNRIKHTNRAPLQAIRFCLEQARVRFCDLDRVAYYLNEETTGAILRRHYLEDFGKPLSHPRMFIHDLLRTRLGADLSADRIQFVPHHICHLVSAAWASGFTRSLILTIDGEGDDVSGLAAVADRDDLEILLRIPEQDSLGKFYDRAIRFLGYGRFEEYKVMGLAAYGDARPLRSAFSSLYELREGGAYRVHQHRIDELEAHCPPRRAGGPILPVHRNFAASLQESLERIVLHMLGWLRQKTGVERLCMAGGVALNCVMAGRVLASGLFDEVFVQPASHDAGCALGAALYAANSWSRPGQPIRSVFWGPDLSDVRVQLERWDSLITFEQCPTVAKRAAELLADGRIIAWVQGRSEFGPRALGHRSILADPRSAAARDRINLAVKERESYRPLAPAVMEEALRRYFSVPPGVDRLPFMTFAVPVHPEQRAEVPAIVHVDGTARVQTVAREDDALFWSLLDEFHRRTNVPLLINTSFNHRVEPIVDTIHDALACFLNIDLDALVVGDFLVQRRTDWRQNLRDAQVTLPPHVELCARRVQLHSEFVIRCISNQSWQDIVSQETYGALTGVAATATLAQLLASVPAARRSGVEAEIFRLWGRRLIELSPASPNSSQGLSQPVTT